MTSSLLPRSRLARALLLAGALVGLPLLAAAAIGRYPDQPSQADPTSRYEERLLARLVDQDVVAVALAERCLEKAPHEQLAMACGEIASARSEQASHLRNCLMNWYGVDHARDIRAVAGGRQAVLDALSGDEFEAVLLEMMTVDQEQAIDEATACLERVRQPELQTICAEVAEQQTARVEQMRDWLCRWHHLQCDIEW